MPGVRHKTAVAGDAELRLVECTTEMAPHWCSVGHVGRILEGRFEMEFDSGAQVLEAGCEAARLAQRPGATIGGGAVGQRGAADERRSAPSGSAVIGGVIVAEGRSSASPS